MPFDPVGYVETKIVDADGEVILLAAKMIEKRGWCQVDFEADDGRLCAVGAIIRAALELNHPNCNRVVRSFDTPEFTLMMWNDLRAKSGAEVIARLRSAAEQGAS